MRSGIKALAALCSLAISVNTGCSNNAASSGTMTEEFPAAARQLTAQSSP